jgi:5-methylcytosine-specific restriction endonuclease McrA
VAALRPCLRCGTLVRGASYCRAHMPVGFYARPSPSSRDRPAPKLRARIKQRDGHRCQRCGLTEKLRVHHVRQVADGGGHGRSNLLTLCDDRHRAEHRRAS